MLPGKNKRQGAGAAGWGAVVLCPDGAGIFPVVPMAVAPLSWEKRKPPLNKNVQRRFLIIDE